MKGRGDGDGFARALECPQRAQGDRLGNSTDGKAGARMVGIGCARGGGRDSEHKGTEVTEGTILPATRRIGSNPCGNRRG